VLNNWRLFKKHFYSLCSHVELTNALFASHCRFVGDIIGPSGPPDMSNRQTCLACRSSLTAAAFSVTCLQLYQHIGQHSFVSRQKLLAADIVGPDFIADKSASVNSALHGWWETYLFSVELFHVVELAFISCRYGFYLNKMVYNRNSKYGCHPLSQLIPVA